MSRVLAFDFGASNGRAILGVLEEGTIRLEEIHRFENVPYEKDATLYWDFGALLSEVQIGISKAGSFDSIGFDTWGVDFGLLDANGKLLSDPVHYRDSRTDGILDKAFASMDAAELYSKTGNQIMPINTLFQLLALKEKQPELLQKAKTLLFMPDLFGYMLSGSAVCEQSIASTSQLLNPLTRDWSTDVTDAFGLERSLLLSPVKSGSVIGSLSNGAKVIAVAGHDTQCAIAALPSESENAAFLSCGTWSLLGTELELPILTEQSRICNLSNELGANGKVNYLKNIIGLWLIQESRRAWRRQGKEYSYSDLERLALEAPPFRSFIDPDSPEFTPPGDIPERVRNFCAKTGQPIPQTTGEVMRCIYESLAMKYRYAVCQLEETTGKRFNALHILGGGTKDRLLCRLTANSCALPVTAGPVEATALGNIILQLVTLNELPDIAAGRALIAETEALTRYIPSETDAWDRAYQTYKTYTALRKE